MIHPGTPTGRNIMKGSMIPGLRYVERDTLHLYATDGDGHEWFTFLEADDLATALWEHRPEACNRCIERRAHDAEAVQRLPERGSFPRPMGVERAERLR